MNVTTTHDPHGGGHPRLIFTTDSSSRLGERGGAADGPYAFELLRGVTRIGSGPDADLRLSGLDAQHAEIRRDAADEYVFVRLSAERSGTVNGRTVEEKPLHTGDHLELGPWRMSYFREEFADHGRPHAGREGGEFSDQQPQSPPRPRGTSSTGGSDPDEDDPGEYF